MFGCKVLCRGQVELCLANCPRSGQGRLSTKTTRNLYHLLSLSFAPTVSDFIML